MYDVWVDSTRCQGHARCFAFAPDIFDFDDEGYAFIPEDRSQHAEIPEDLRLAIANCPERAIQVKDNT
ncbi:ferredoxin [Rhodococcus opacus]|uniref:ferredoxin n=1 Tax=Rhodococcus opacus TaxID=37919 RepID=UPI001C4901D8|nr:ferredoxin [Rhodococcus opacus]MBV6755480.1 ferredoxin [Rhodococcus opacus]